MSDAKKRVAGKFPVDGCLYLSVGLQICEVQPDSLAQHNCQKGPTNGSRCLVYIVSSAAVLGLSD